MTKAKTTRPRTVKTTRDETREETRLATLRALDRVVLRLDHEELGIVLALARLIPGKRLAGGAR